MGTPDNEATFEEALDEVIDAAKDSLKTASAEVRKLAIGHLLYWSNFSSDVRTRISQFWALKRSLMFEEDEPQVVFLSMDHKGCHLSKDGVHLTEAGAKNYFGRVLDQASRAFQEAMELDKTTDDTSQKSDVSGSWSEHEREEDEGSTQVRTGSGRNKAVNSGRKRNLSAGSEETVVGMNKHSRREYVLESTYESNRKTDLLAFAKIAEDQDAVENKTNLNKVMIMGLNLPGILQMDRNERAEPMRKAVMKFLKQLNKAVPDFEVAKPVRCLLANEGAMRRSRKKKPMIEAVFENASYGLNLRATYGKLSTEWKSEGKRQKTKIPKAFTGVYVNPSLNHRTRVRIEVMRAISAGFNKAHRGEKGTSWVIPHLPRPLLKTVVKTGKDKSQEKVRTLNYVSAVSMALADGLVGPQDLLEAQKYAGSGYGKHLEHFFILLK